MEYSEDDRSHVFQFAGALVFGHDNKLYSLAVEVGDFRFNFQREFFTAKDLNTATLQALSKHLITLDF